MIRTALYVILSCIVITPGAFAEASRYEFLRVDGFIEGVDPNPSPVISNFDECVAAGNPVMRSMPPKCATSDGHVFVQQKRPSQTRRALCKDLCGNGECEQVVCMGEGCPCAESKSSCPADCT